MVSYCGSSEVVLRLLSSTRHPPVAFPLGRACRLQACLSLFCSFRSWPLVVVINLVVCLLHGGY